MNVQAISDLAIRGAPGTGDVPEAQPARPAHEPGLRASDQPSLQTEADPDEVAHAVEGVNAFLKSNNNHIQFALHQGAGRMMVEVIDNETKEIIKTIPSKELLDLSAKIGELVGTLLDERG